ncbi:MAG: electron transfer flavoprotein subunit alpha/FixB family protein [Nitrososphaerota archaeon]|nr:electron transfer flavoprotein subunit alpha/FixB family protein [Nitrososphaerota archaeon]
MNVTDSKHEIFVFVEQTDGIIEQVSLEVLGKAREIANRLGSSVAAVILGENVSELARDVSTRGADIVFAGDSPLLRDYTTEAYSKVVASLIKERDPDSLLIGATHNGASLAASLAVRVGAGLMAHVIDLEIEEGTAMLLGSVPGFGGSIVSVCKCSKGRPQMATVRPGIFKPLEPLKSNKTQIEYIKLNLSEADKKCNVLERNVKRTKEISRAERVVVAGLGCKDLALPKKLAEEINAEFAVSRPVADRGLYDREHVVGSTGSSLNAELAIVLGVSGAAHFVSGIRDVKKVIAINTDPKSQIFKQADYCVNADVFEILPLLNSELAKS